MWKLSFYLENSGIVMNLKADASYVLAWLGGAEVQIPWQAQKAHKKGGLGNLHREIVLMLNEEGCGAIRLHEAMLLSHNPLQKNKQTKKNDYNPKQQFQTCQKRGVSLEVHARPGVCIFYIVPTVRIIACLTLVIAMLHLLAAEWKPRPLFDLQPGNLRSLYLLWVTCNQTREIVRLLQAAIPATTYGKFIFKFKMNATDRSSAEYPYPSNK